MRYSDLVRVYEALESTTSRLEMTSILSSLFKEADCTQLRKIIYLTQGEIYPDFVPIKLGVGDKIFLRALLTVCGLGEKKVRELWLKEGDPGTVSQIVLESKKQRTLFSESLTLNRVYEGLENIARSEGSGSQDTKIKLIADLLHDAEPIEARYIARLITGRMRLGVAEMTVIDALTQAFAAKRDKEVVERAFNVTSDLGLVGEVLCERGIEGVRNIHVKVGNPIRAMLAERLPSPQEILDRMGGKCAFEYKYDGLRIQAHINGEKITLYSRRLEDLTSQFPDVVSSLKKSFKCRSGIVEGECVPIDMNTGELLPFQEVSHRRGRKHELSSAIEDYPVEVFLFDCLYVDDEDLTEKPYLKRRDRLAKCIDLTEEVRLSEMRILDNVDDVERFFEEALQAGCEGLMAKSISEDSIYRAGARGYLWIKYKKEYRSEMTDTVDLVVVGAFAGRGRRGGFYGALLMATYNEDGDNFETACKLGSGFDDPTLQALPEKLEKWRLPEKHPRVESNMDADVWFEPSLVLEVLGAEITLSPIHTAAYGAIRKDAGLAIRFPRFTGKFREDKKSRQATTSKELLEMYQKQAKRVES